MHPSDQKRQALQLQKQHAMRRHQVPQGFKGRWVLIDNLGVHMTSEVLTEAVQSMVDGVVVSPCIYLA